MENGVEVIVADAVKSQRVSSLNSKKEFLNEISVPGSISPSTLAKPMKLFASMNMKDPLSNDENEAFYFKTFFTTLTYYNTLLQDHAPVVRSSLETISNVVSVPLMSQGNYVERTQVGLTTSTYLVKQTYTTINQDLETVTSEELVTQVVVTEIPSISRSLIPSIHSTNAGINNPTTVSYQLENSLLATKIYYTTSTYYTTLVRGKNTVTSSHVETTSSVIVEPIKPTILSHLLTEKHSTDQLQQFGTDVFEKHRYISLKSNVYKQLRTLFATYTYYTTLQNGQITSTEVTKSQMTFTTITTTSIPASLLINVGSFGATKTQIPNVISNTEVSYTRGNENTFLSPSFVEDVMASSITSPLESENHLSGDISETSKLNATVLVRGDSNEAGTYIVQDSINKATLVVRPTITTRGSLNSIIQPVKLPDKKVPTRLNLAKPSDSSSQSSANENEVISTNEDDNNKLSDNRNSIEIGFSPMLTAVAGLIGNAFTGKIAGEQAAARRSKIDIPIPPRNAIVSGERRPLLIPVGGVAASLSKLREKTKSPEGGFIPIRPLRKTGEVSDPTVSFQSFTPSFRPPLVTETGFTAMTSVIQPTRVSVISGEETIFFDGLANTNSPSIDDTNNLDYDNKFVDKFETTDILEQEANEAISHFVVYPALRADESDYIKFEETNPLNSFRDIVDYKNPIKETRPLNSFKDIVDYKNPIEERNPSNIFADILNYKNNLDIVDSKRPLEESKPHSSKVVKYHNFIKPTFTTKTQSPKTNLFNIPQPTRSRNDFYKSIYSKKSLSRNRHPDLAIRTESPATASIKTKRIQNTVTPKYKLPLIDDDVLSFVFTTATTPVLLDLDNNKRQTTSIRKQIHSRFNIRSHISSTTKSTVLTPTYTSSLSTPYTGYTSIIKPYSGIGTFKFDRNISKETTTEKNKHTTKTSILRKQTTERSNILKPQTTKSSNIVRQITKDELITAIRKNNPKKTKKQNLEKEAKTEDNETSKSSIYKVSKTKKVSVIKKCEKSCSKFEVCKNISEENECVCKPGYSRSSKNEPCTKTRSFEIEFEIQLLNGGNSKLKEELRVDSHPKRKNLSNQLSVFIKDTMRNTSMSSKYHTNSVVDLKVMDERESPVSLVAKIKVDTQSDVTEVLQIGSIVPLRSQDDEKAIKTALEKSLDSAIFSLDEGETLGRITETALAVRDFDECSHPGHNDCDENANCINMAGSFTCACREGYKDVFDEGNLIPGRKCVESNTCSYCNYHGKCRETAGETLCECNEWFSGEKCEINMKVLLIAVVSAGIFLFVVFLISLIFCCCRATTNHQSVLLHSSGYGGGERSTLDRRGIIQEISSDSSQDDPSRPPMVRSIPESPNIDYSLGKQSGMVVMAKNPILTSKKGAVPSVIIPRIKSYGDSRTDFPSEDTFVDILEAPIDWNREPREVGRGKTPQNRGMRPPKAPELPKNLRNNDDVLDSFINVHGQVPYGHPARKEIRELSPDSVRLADRAMSQARSCDETTVLAPRKLFSAGSMCSRGMSSQMLSDIPSNAERDGHSTIVYPQMKLYKPIRESDSMSDVTGQTKSLEHEFF